MLLAQEKALSFSAPTRLTKNIYWTSLYWNNQFVCIHIKKEKNCQVSQYAINASGSLMPHIEHFVIFLSQFKLTESRTLQKWIHRLCVRQLYCNWTTIVCSKCSHTWACWIYAPSPMYANVFVRMRKHISPIQNQNTPISPHCIVGTTLRTRKLYEYQNFCAISVSS